MATVKIYECPKCLENFTTAVIKSNNGKCPGCNVPLRHEIKTKVEGGGIYHAWVFDEEHESVGQDKIPIGAPDPFSLITRNENPEIYLAKGRIKEGAPRYKVVYRDRFSQTNLRCPMCGSYLHTTNAINGSRQNVYCRSRRNEEGSNFTCKTRTLFIFARNGEAVT